MVCAIAKIGFFNEGRGNQSDLAFRRTPRSVSFWGLATDFAMTADGWFSAVGEYMSDGMTNQADLTGFEVETMGESSGQCDCCGNESRRVWGMIHHQGGRSVAAYWMHWTVGHLSEPGANLDLVMGKWGDGTDAHDRFGVALVHRQLEDGTPSLMVVDADDRFSNVDLVATALKRRDVINTPLAEQVFSIVDAIYLQDGRFF